MTNNKFHYGGELEHKKKLRKEDIQKPIRERRPVFQAIFEFFKFVFYGFATKKKLYATS
jgi:hypothetical protein